MRQLQCPGLHGDLQGRRQSCAAEGSWGLLPLAPVPQLPLGHLRGPGELPCNQLSSELPAASFPLLASHRHQSRHAISILVGSPLPEGRTRDQTSILQTSSGGEMPGSPPHCNQLLY